MVAEPSKGLFGVRGFGLYERWTSWVGDKADGEEEEDEDAGGFGFGAVSVLARCRPLLRSRDASCDVSADAAPEGTRLHFRAPQVGLHEICCSAYLGPDSTQEAVFAHAAYIVERTVDGCNGLVLCCGSGRSGKTYTMVGPTARASPDDGMPSEGIIPRAARLLFETMQSREEVFVVEASFLDICPCGAGVQEQLVDLLTERSGGRLRIQQDPLRPQTYACEGLSRTPVRRPEKVIELLEAGLKRREALEAAQRLRPRGAHCVFTISLESLAVEEGALEPSVKRGKLLFVEFAGLPSPGLARGSGGPSAQRSPALELLLTDCVRGDAPVLLVANFCPELQHAEESVRTLALAENALLGGVQEPLEEAAPPVPPAPASPTPVPAPVAAAARSAAAPEPRAAPPPDAVPAQAARVPSAAPTAASVAPPTATGLGRRPPALAKRAPSREATLPPFPHQPPPPAPAAAPAQGIPRAAAAAAPLASRAAAPPAAAPPPEVPVPTPEEAAPAPAVEEEEEEEPPPLQPAQTAVSASPLDNRELKFRSGMGAARVAELEDQLREVVACRRAIEMESAQLKVKVASTEERVRLLREIADELLRDRGSHQEEHRTLRTKTDMQQQKLIMYEDELRKMQAEVAEKRAEATHLSAQQEAESASQSQERAGWRTQEAELQQKAAKTRRELEEFRRKASVERLRAEKAGDETSMQLRLQIQQLRERAAADSAALERAQRSQATMETERRIQEQREEAIKEEGMRKMLMQQMQKQEIEEMKTRIVELETMLTELQEGLLNADEEEDGAPPMTIAGA